MRQEIALRAYIAAANPARGETPVEPVSALRRLSADAPARKAIPVQELPAVQGPQLPSAQEPDSAVETLARMRIQYGEGLASVL